MPDAPYVFVSYSHSDASYVERLIGLLAGRGVGVKRDSDIRKGERYVPALTEMVKSASAVLVVMSPHAAESEHVEREIMWAEDAGVPIMPVLLRGTIFPQLVNKQVSDVPDGGILPDATVRDIEACLRAGTDEDAEPRFDPTSTVGFSDIIAKYITSAESREAAVKVKATGEFAVRMRFADMLPLLDEALEIDPAFVPAHVNRAFALNSLRRWDEALASADRALALAPDEPVPHQHRAIALAGLGRWSDALPATERSVALDPDNAQAHFQRAYVLGRLKRWDEAVRALDRVLELSPDLKQAKVLRRVATVGKWTGRLRLPF